MDMYCLQDHLVNSCLAILCKMTYVCFSFAERKGTLGLIELWLKHVKCYTWILDRNKHLKEQYHMVQFLIISFFQISL